MAVGLVGNHGHFRKGGVCVAGKEGISHIAPPADMVPLLISDLFDLLKNSDDHILIKSSVFHYDFEFIHPFEDGNGRLGRFWQTKILSEWNPIFVNLPVENMIWENQAEYYRAIKQSTDSTDSGIFIEFMLGLILRTLKDHIQADTVNLIMKLMKENSLISYEELARRTGKSRATISRRVAELKKQGMVERVGADKNGSWKVNQEI